jgi:hypothetical protein
MAALRLGAFIGMASSALDCARCLADLDANVQPGGVPGSEILVKEEGK